MSVSNLFVCSTPYQLLNAISIAISCKSESDIIFTSPEVVESIDIGLLKESKVFHECYIWNDLSRKIGDRNISSRIDSINNSIKKVIYYSRISKNINTLPNKIEQYNNIFTSYLDYPAQLIYSNFRRKGVVLHFYEDGTYAYYVLSRGQGRLRTFISKVLFGYNIIQECRYIWVRKPQLLEKGEHTSVRVRKIPLLSNDTSAIAKVFGLNDKVLDAFNRRVIYFDSYDKLQNSTLLKVQDSIVKILADTFRDDLVVKPHPQYTRSHYAQDLIVASTKVPFELINAFVNMDDKVLVSIFSTASFSPKLIFDQEPNLVFLYKLTDLESRNNYDYDGMIKKISSMYSRNKVSVPGSIHDLMELLKRYE